MSCGMPFGRRENAVDSKLGGLSPIQMIQGRLFFSDDRFQVAIESFNSKRNDYLFPVNANSATPEATRENDARFIKE